MADVFNVNNGRRTSERDGLSIRAAFTVLRVVDGPPVEAHGAKLRRAVAAGDILLFRAWWGDPVNDQVKRLYNAAAGPAGR